MVQQGYWEKNHVDYGGILWWRVLRLKDFSTKWEKLEKEQFNCFFWTEIESMVKENSTKGKKWNPANMLHFSFIGTQHFSSKHRKSVRSEPKLRGIDKHGVSLQHVHFKPRFWWEIVLSVKTTEIVFMRQTAGRSQAKEMKRVLKVGVPIKKGSQELYRWGLWPSYGTAVIV